MKRLFWAILALILALPVTAPAALRISSTSSTSNKVEFGTTDVTFQTTGSLSMWFKLNASPASFNGICSRKARHATDGPTLKSWGVLANDGTGAKITLDWYVGSTQNILKPMTAGIDSAPLFYGTGTGVGTTLSTATWYHLLLTRDSVTGLVTIEVDGPSLSATSSATLGAPNNGDVNARFSIGCDYGQTGTGAPIDFAEVQYTSTGRAGQGASLYNAGIAKRLMDLFPSVSLVNYWDAFQDGTSTVVDKAGSSNGSCTGVTRPNANYIDHPPMYEPIISVRADTGLYSDAGTTPATAEGRIQQWNDQSGRKLHITQSTSGLRPLWLSTDKRKPYVWFDKYDPATPAWRYSQMSFPTNIRFDSQNFTAVTVARLQSMGTNSESAGTNNYFQTLWQVDGASSTRFNIGSTSGLDTEQTGIVRFGGVDSGLGADGLFTPSSPSLYIVEGAAGGASVWMNNGTANESDTFSAATATSSSGQGTLGGHSSNTQFSLWGGIYEFRVFNRQIGSTDRATERTRAASLWPITLNPDKIVILSGSSSAEGYASQYDNGVASYLFERTSSFRNALIFNFGKGSSRLNGTGTDTGDAGGTVYSHETVAAKSVDFIPADYPTLPVWLLNWVGPNDIAVASRTAAQVLADAKTFIGNRKTNIGAGRVKLCALFQLSGSSDYDSDENTIRATYNASLLSDSEYGSTWNRVIRLVKDPILEDASADISNDYTNSDNKHWNDAGFYRVYLRALRDLYPENFMRNRSRPLRVR